MKRWVLFVCLWLAATAVAVAADTGPTVAAHVDRTTLAPGESLRLMVTIRDGEADVNLSGLADFKTFSQGSSTSVQIINGVTTKEETHTYLLIPQKQGRLTIPALTVTIDGRVFKTEPITIDVTARPAPDAAGTSREVWVQASLSDGQPYAGQQITYTFSFYQAVQVTDATFQPPAFNGFSAKEIKERSSEHKYINGREYVVTQIFYVLVPLKAGRYVIEPAALQLGIVRPDTRRRRSPFDDFFNDPFLSGGRVELKVLQSQALSVMVKALPPLEGPAPFSGLVGRFDMSAEVENTQLHVGDSTTLAITVQGHGNIMDAQAPALQVPDSFKTYADAPEEKIQLSPDGYSGKKVFRTALVPIKAGGLQLPSVHLTYFDVGQGRYQTLRASLPELQVQAATESAAAPITMTPEALTTQKQKVAFTGRDILPPKEGLDALQPQRPLSGSAFLLWVIGPCLAFGGLILIQQLLHRDNDPAARMKSKAQQSLKTAQSGRDDQAAFLTALYQALTSAIYYRADRSGEALTWREAETLLAHSGTDTAATRQAVDLLTAIESSKFSGSELSAQQRDDLLHNTRDMVKRLAP